MGSLFSRLSILCMPCWLQIAPLAPSSRVIARSILQHKPTRDTLVGKAAVVTGVTYGTIGFYIAQALALEAGMAVLLCGRDVEKLRDAARKIAEQAAAEGKLKPIMYQIILDLDDLDNVQRASEDVGVILRRDFGGHLQILVNNAGGASANFKLTKQGIESNTGSNYVGPFLLTRELLPFLRATGMKGAHAPRVVNVSSIAHASGTMAGYSAKNLLESPHHGGTPHTGSGMVIVEDKKNDGRLTFKNGLIGSISLYAISKGMQVSHSRAIARRERDSGVRAVSCHPGSVATNFGNFHDYGRAYYKWLGIFQYTPDQGASTPIHCALSPALNGPSSGGGRGAYFHCTRHEVEPYMPGGDAFDEELYDVTERIVDEKLCGMVM